MVKEGEMRDGFNDFFEGSTPSEVHKAMELRQDVVDIILDQLTDGYVKAFHEFGRGALGQSRMVEIDCSSCGAFIIFNVMSPVDDFMFVLKETLKTEEFQRKIALQIEKGRGFNERKGFKVQSISKKDEPEGDRRQSIKVD